MARVMERVAATGGGAPPGSGRHSFAHHNQYHFSAEQRVESHPPRPSFLRSCSDRAAFNSNPPPPRPSFLKSYSDKNSFNNNPPPPPRQSFLNSDSALLGNKPKQKNKRRMTLGGLRGAQEFDGLFTSFRRMSADPQSSLALQEELANGNNAKSSSVSEYHAVFQQMKRENPSSSLGALQQKTMTKIAEQKVKKEQQEQQERQLQQQKDEEERLRHQTLAKKCVDKWVGKIRHTSHQEHHGDSKLGANNSNESDRDDEIVTQSIPHGSRSSILRRRPSNAPDPLNRRISLDSNRRSSMDSGTAPPSIKENEESMLYIHAGLVPGGDDQGANFAPRKSVGDLAGLDACDFLDEKSVQSYLTDASGLFVDAESVATSGSKLSACISRLSGTHGAEDFQVSEITGLSLLSTGGSEERTGRKKCSTEVDIGGTESSTCTGPNATYLHETLSTGRSVASDFASYYSMASLNGLLVGFEDRSVTIDGSELIVEFVDPTRRREKRAVKEDGYISWQKK